VVVLLPMANSEDAFDFRAIPSVGRPVAGNCSP
jgi:hypothetical protein